MLCKMQRHYAEMLCSKCGNVMLKMHKTHAQNVQNSCSKCRNVMLKMQKCYAQNAQNSCLKCGNVMHITHAQKCGNVMLKLRKRYAQTLCAKYGHYMHSFPLRTTAQLNTQVIRVVVALKLRKDAYNSGPEQIQICGTFTQFCHTIADLRSSYKREGAN